MNHKSHSMQDDTCQSMNAIPSTRQKVDVELVSYVMKQNTMGLWTSIICATIILISFYKSERFAPALGWYAAFWIVTFIRFFFVKSFLSQPLKFGHVIRWQRLFTLGAGLSGLCWGFAGGVLLPYENPIQFTLMIMILAGMTAGAVPILAGILSAAIVFLLATLLPLSLHLILIPNVLYILFGVATSIYMGYLILLSIRTHEMLRSTISLQFENDQLLEHLSIAKNELEVTNKKLAYAATHDFLTHLANRGLFEIKFNEALKRTKQTRKMLALFYIDVDNFKKVNDLYGHSTGDKLLQEIAKRIKGQLPENAIAARLGGDEITIVIDQIIDKDFVVKFAENLCFILSDPFEIKGFTILISVSIGISLYAVDGDKADVLLKSADNAMYFIKHKGGNSYHFNTDLTT